MKYKKTQENENVSCDCDCAKMFTVLSGLGKSTLLKYPQCDRNW